MKTSLKVFISAFIMAVIVIAVGGSAIGAAQYRVFYEEKEIIFDAAPYEKNGRLLAPVRAISEATGAKVDWNGKLNTVTIYRGSDKLLLTIGSKIALYNDVEIPMDVAPAIKDGRTFLPIRFVAEWLGLQVNYEGSTVRMYRQRPLTRPDTMNAPKGNTNGNLNNKGFAIVWQDMIFWDVADGRLVSKKITDTGYGWTELMNWRAYPRYFNIWKDQLYVNVYDDFVRIDEKGNILHTVVENVSYCQIHDGWLYFVRLSDKQLCRRLLDGGAIQPLGVFDTTSPDWRSMEYLEIVITDQHIYTNDGWSILMMNLNGSNRKRILDINCDESIRAYGCWLCGLEYANGQLFVNVGANRPTARICRLNPDGTGLRALVQDGATEINAIGDRLYYTKLADVPSSLDLHGSSLQGVDMARVRLDGSEREVLGTGDYSAAYSCPTLMPDGSVYYRYNKAGMGNEWLKIEES